MSFRFSVFTLFIILTVDFLRFVPRQQVTLHYVMNVLANQGSSGRMCGALLTNLSIRYLDHPSPPTFETSIPAKQRHMFYNFAAPNF